MSRATFASSWAYEMKQVGEPCGTARFSNRAFSVATTIPIYVGWMRQLPPANPLPPIKSWSLRFERMRQVRDRVLDRLPQTALAHEAGLLRRVPESKRSRELKDLQPVQSGVVVFICVTRRRLPHS